MGPDIRPLRQLGPRQTNCLLDFLAARGEEERERTRIRGRSPVFELALDCLRQVALARGGERIRKPPLALGHWLQLGRLAQWDECTRDHTERYQRSSACQQRRWI